MIYKKIIKIKYSKNIQILRSVAVLAVLSYHLDENLLPFGFLGVDLFFVISGFVISNLLYSQFLDNSLKLKHFYYNRFKRLIPSLLSYCIFVNILSFFVLDFRNTIETSKATIYSMFFIANVYFSRFLDYFQPDSKKSLVINLWSLSVEEQFYLILPFFILLLFKISKDINLHFKIFIGIFFISILFLNKYVYNLIPIFGKIFLNYENFTFYSIFSRIYQFLIGIISMFLNQYFAKYKLKMSPLIYFSFIPIFLEFNNVNIGINRIFLLCITSLILIFDIDFFSIKTLKEYLTFIGKISYSLYLFHQAIISGFKNLLPYLENEIHNNLTFNYVLINFILLFITFLISCLNYYFVENYFRYTEHKNIFKNNKFIFLIMFFIVLTSISAYTKGYAFKNNELKSFVYETELQFLTGTNYLIQDSENCLNREGFDKLCKFENSELNDNQEYKIIVFGDSMMSSMMSGFLSQQYGKNYIFYEYTKGGCPLLITQCGFNVDSLKKIELDELEGYIFIVGGRYQKYLDTNNFKTNLEETLKTLSKNNKVFFVLPIPEPTINLRMHYFINNYYPIIDLENYFLEHQEVSEIVNNFQIEKLEIIDLQNEFCQDSVCQFFDNENYYFIDHVHFTYFGALKAANAIMEFINSN